MKLNDLVEQKFSEAQSFDDLAKILYGLLNGNFGLLPSGEIYHIRQLVDFAAGGIKIEIFSNEHPPPHFHVKSGELRASFSIDDCALLEGKISTRKLSLVKWWHSRSKDKLIEIWNDTRPSGCSVGKFVAKN